MNILFTLPHFTIYHDFSGRTAFLTVEIKKYFEQIRHCKKNSLQNLSNNHYRVRTQAENVWTEGFNTTGCFHLLEEPRNTNGLSPHQYRSSTIKVLKGAVAAETPDTVSLGWICIPSPLLILTSRHEK